MIDEKYYDYAARQMARADREKKKYNGYKDKADRICFYTGLPYAERHEVFAGANRRISIRCGFQVDLCAEKHRELQDNITPWAKEENQKWRETYQSAYMDRQMRERDDSEDDALATWMWLIGRNYIEELMPL